jgi:hypothetical protein
VSVLRRSKSGKRLCSFSSLSQADCGFQVVFVFCFDNGVEDDKQFPHACHEDNFGEFALSCEPVGKIANHRIVSTGCEGRHVQPAAATEPTPPD